MWQNVMFVISRKILSYSWNLQFFRRQNCGFSTHSLSLLNYEFSDKYHYLPPPIKILIISSINWIKSYSYTFSHICEGQYLSNWLHKSKRLTCGLCRCTTSQFGFFTCATAALTFNSFSKEHSIEKPHIQPLNCNIHYYFHQVFWKRSWWKWYIFFPRKIEMHLILVHLLIKVTHMDIYINNLT